MDSSIVDEVFRVAIAGGGSHTAKLVVEAAKPIAEQVQVDLSTAALVFDTNVLLRLAQGRDAATTIDYLSSVHRAPIVVPNQVLVEFWNRRLDAAQDLIERVRNKFGELEGAIQSIDDDYKQFSTEVRAVFSKYQTEYGYVLDDKPTELIGRLLSVFAAKAITVRAPLDRIASVAPIRSSLKIPPGFADAGHGDFVVWIEALIGLVGARASGADFDHVLLVTHDFAKSDWSTKGSAHPHLRAEVMELLGTPLTTWTADRFTGEVAKTFA